MTKRSYPFGYCCEKGEITINEKEGEVVKRIFEEYAEGRSLKEIADRLNEQGIAFKTAVSPWHKSRVHHLLTDGRYIGEKNYPPLIAWELFERIARLRENKYGETEPVSETIRYLQKNVVCGACGSRYVRKLGKKGGRYWVCGAHGCGKVLAESRLLSAIETIIEKVVKKRELLYGKTQETGYHVTAEIVRMTNQWNALNGQCGFAAGKTMLLALASEKFSASREDKSIYTDAVYDALFEKLQGRMTDGQLFRRVIRKVIVAKDGNLALEFANGAIVSLQEE